MCQISLSTMWAKDRFGNIAEFVVKAREFGFTHMEANSSVSPQGLNELIETSFPISSIHCPCPAALTSKGIPVANLSLSSLEKNEQEEAINFTKKTIDLARKVGAKAVVLHMGEVPINLGLDDELRWLYQQNLIHTERYSRVKEQLSYQRSCKAPPYLEAARKSLKELTEYAEHRGIMLGLETRFHLHEMPNIDEMAKLLNEVAGRPVGYWHDMGHAEVQQRLGFASHGEWLLRFRHRIIGVHLHDVLGVSDHYAPGKGDINWEMVAKYLPGEAIKVCEIAEWNEEGDIQGVVNFLQEKGIL